MVLSWSNVFNDRFGHTPVSLQNIIVAKKLGITICVIRLYVDSWIQTWVMKNIANTVHYNNDSYQRQFDIFDRTGL